MIKLAIGIPNTGTIKSGTFFSVVSMLKRLPYEHHLIMQASCAIHHNREKIVEVALKLGCTHLLFVDSDMSFDKDAAEKLIDRQKDIVGVHYNQRRLPLTSTVLMPEEKRAKIKEEHPDGFLTCDGVGTGFMLINLEVFKKLPKPWFFWDLDGETSEDFYFCKKAREHGFDIWVDLTVPVKHIGDYLY